MYQNRPRRFRRRSNGRSHRPHDNGDMKIRIRSDSFSKGPVINYSKTTQNVEKLVEKYKDLAKESLSSGDISLSENYFQHADHFMRIIENKNINQQQNKVQDDGKLVISDQDLVKNISVNQDRTTDEKEEKKE